VFCALTFACLFSSMSGCADQTVITKTEYRQVYVPESLLLDCHVPQWQPGGSYRDLAVLAVKRKTALDDCNLRMGAARRYQAEIRASEANLMTNPSGERSH
jgi:hypothetical protein